MVPVRLQRIFGSAPALRVLDSSESSLFARHAWKEVNRKFILPIVPFKEKFRTRRSVYLYGVAPMSRLLRAGDDCVVQLFSQCPLNHFEPWCRFTLLGVITFEWWHRHRGTWSTGLVLQHVSKVKTLRKTALILHETWFQKRKQSIIVYNESTIEPSGDKNSFHNLNFFCYGDPRTTHFSSII